MKKVIVRLFFALLILLVLVVVGLSLFLNDALKRGFEVVGPHLTKTPVTVESVKLSLLSGSGTINGLIVRNPAGYKTPSAISADTMSLVIDPTSLFSDKVIVKSILLESPQITFETDLKKNNLQQILDNLEASAGGGTNAPETARETSGASRKLEVDRFLITNGQIHISVTGMSGQGATATLKEIRLTDLGKGPEGITAAELAKVVLQSLEKSAVQAGSGTISDIQKGAMYFSKEPSQSSSNALEKATEGIDNLLKKK